MWSCPRHKNLMDWQVLSLTESEAAICDELWRRWWILQPRKERR